jgi:hypothetical protein
MNRRTFMTSALGAGGLLILPNAASARTYQANERVNVALIGVDGRGHWFSQTMPDLSNVVAMCDVNERRAAKWFEQNPKARRFVDFRKMLDEMEKEIDGVTVATPDNTHAVAAAAAIRHGKGVLCEKPLTHDVAEARALRKLAAEYKVPSQMGNQGTASPAFRRSVEIVQDGVLGEVREVIAWNDGGGQGERPVPKGSEPVPEGVAWDLWLGPAAWREFHSEWYKWHGWRDFATGNLGNWAPHTMNLPFKALKIDTLWSANDLPVEKRTIRIEAEKSGIYKHSFPRWELVHYDVPARGDMPPVRIDWCNGAATLEEKGVRKRLEDLMKRPLDRTDSDGDGWKDWAGILLIGQKGLLHSIAHNTTLTLMPEAAFKDVARDPQRLPNSPGHEREWLDAVKGGPAPMSNFNYSGPLAEFCLLGNVATLVEGPLDFDPVAMKITNNTEANALLAREYRKGWAL